MRVRDRFVRSRPIRTRSGDPPFRKAAPFQAFRREKRPAAAKPKRASPREETEPTLSRRGGPERDRDHKTTANFRHTGPALRGGLAACLIAPAIFMNKSRGGRAGACLAYAHTRSPDGMQLTPQGHQNGQARALTPLILIRIQVPQPLDLIQEIFLPDAASAHDQLRAPAMMAVFRST